MTYYRFYRVMWDDLIHFFDLNLNPVFLRLIYDGEETTVRQEGEFLVIDGVKIKPSKFEIFKTDRRTVLDIEGESID